MKKLFSMLVLCICVLSIYSFADSKPGRLPTYLNHNDLANRDAVAVHPHASLEAVGAEDHHTLPIRATMWHDESTVVTGNAFQTQVDTAQRYNIKTFQNAAANGDIFTNNFYLKEGSYTLYLLGLTQIDKGIQDIYIDTIFQNSIDWYGGGANNVIRTISITVLGNGLHTLKSIVNGKNAEATAYLIYITKMWIK